MGISGLTSYIQCYIRESLEWHQLKNCHVVIDGNNLAYDLYSPSKLNMAFGGDYDKFAACVEAFFKSLIQCNIKITIVMDGGHAAHGEKFDTVFSRINKQINLCQNIKFTDLNNLLLFPLHGRSVFVNVAQRMNIEVLQGDFETDEDIAVVAKRLDAYVISNDSDFYLFGSSYVLLSSLNYKKVQTEKLETGKMEKFIPCYKFNLDKFSKRTKIPKSVMPIIAPLLGNDNISYKNLQFFYNKLYKLRPPSKLMSERHRTITSVFRWISKQRDLGPDQILNKFFGFMPVQGEDIPDKDLFRVVMSSYQVSSSTLSPWVDKHEEKCPTNTINMPEQMTSQISLGSLEFKEDFLPPQIKREFMCRCKDRINTDMLHSAELPSWFLKAYRMHLISNDVSDILNKSYLFTLPQIEVSSMKCVYLELKHIVTGVRALLFKTLFEYFELKEKGVVKYENGDILSKLNYSINPETLIDCPTLKDDDDAIVEGADYDSDSDVDVVIEEEDDDGGELFFDKPSKIEDISELRAQRNIPPMNWYIRKNDELWAYCLPEENSDKYKDFPSLLDIDKIPLEERQRLFFTISKLEMKFSEELPRNLEFILYCICFWYVKFKNRVKQSGVLAHLMCTLMFFVIDGKNGRTRPQRTAKNFQAASEAVEQQLQSGVLPDPSTLTILELINSLTREECLMANISLSQHHNFDASDFSNPHKYRQILHTFSAFQSSVYFLQILNSILFFPYPTVNISSFWSGIFCYSVQRRFQKNSFSSVLKLFGNNVRIKALFIRLYNVIRKRINLPQCFQTPYFMAPKNISDKGESTEIVNKEIINNNAKRKMRSRRRKRKGPDAPEVEVWEDATKEDVLNMAENKFMQLVLG